MKKILYIATLLWGMTLISCNNLFNIDPSDQYDGSLKEVSITLAVSSDFDQYDKSNFSVVFDELTSGNIFEFFANSNGILKAEIPYGIYNLRAAGKISTQDGKLIFNGTRDRVTFNAGSNGTFSIDLISSISGAIIIKEIYNGGCLKLPEEGDLYSDKYIILYNNSDITQYLDGICIGTADPGNATATNAWMIPDPGNPGSYMLPDIIYIQDAAVKFPGNGTNFPLAPGEQAVLAFNKAVDHTKMFPLSVNLDKADYFVTYDLVHFDNVANYHELGANIRQDHLLNIVRKLGIGNAYSPSINSPALLIYRIPSEVGTLEQYAFDESNIISKPGTSSNAVYMKLNPKWTLDAVEVFNGTSTNNNKRFNALVDAGYVALNGTYQNKTLYRNVDEEATLDIPGNEQFIVRNYSLGGDPSGIDAEATIKKGGRIIYLDTNNSSVDFHERRKQSLHSSAPINQ